MKKKVVIIGGVALGATAAAKLRRLDEEIEINIIEKGNYISFANCGLPYHISGDIPERDDLILQNPESFSKRFNVDVRTNHKAISIDRFEKTLMVETPTGEEKIAYDILVLAQGGRPFIPNIPHAQLAHTLTNIEELDGIMTRLSMPIKKAVILGGGFIGVEIAEALIKRGVKTTIYELGPSILSIYEPEFQNEARRVLEEKGVEIILSTRLETVDTDPEVLTIFATGVLPRNELAKDAGLLIDELGSVWVNDFLETSDPDIYAGGDLISLSQRIHGKKERIPLAGPANRQGRIIAENIVGKKRAYTGALGTSIIKIFDYSLGATGLSYKNAQKHGLDVGTVTIHKTQHASYFPDAHELKIILNYEKSTGQILGANVFGKDGVDKRIDIIAMALYAKMSVYELLELDFAYAPSFSSAQDPLQIAAMAAIGDIEGNSPLISQSEFVAISKDFIILDVRTKGEYEQGHIPGALQIDLNDLRKELGKLDPEQSYVIYCQAGYRGHIAQRILRAQGFEKTKNLSGGYLSYKGVNHV